MSIYTGNDLKDRMRILETENDSLKNTMNIYLLETENDSLKNTMNTIKWYMKLIRCQT